MARFPCVPPGTGPVSRAQRFLGAFLCLLAATLPAHAQWQTRPAPWQEPSRMFEADTQAFAILEVDTPPGRLLFASGVLNGQPAFYRSSDEGLTWQVNAIGGYAHPAVYWAGTVPTPQGIPSRRGDLYVTVVVSGDALGDYGCDPLRSSDAGATWTVVARNTGACVIVIDPSAPLVMYGMGVGYGSSFHAALYRSSDGGSSWQYIGANLQFAFKVLRAAADGTLYALADSVHVSHDHGDTWTTALNWPTTGESPAGRVGASDLVTWRHPVFGDRFALIATSNGLYQTTDAGVTWLPAGLQGFFVDFLDLVDDPVGAELQVRIGYRRGLALLRGETIVSLTNGLPANIDPVPKAGRYVLSRAALSICTDLQSCAGGTLPHTATLIEYHNSILDHYFMTLYGSEADGIDHGAAGPGWSRTGVTFKVYPDLTGTALRFQPVCRFYGTPEVGPNSHFYTIDRQECIDVRADPGWTLESTGAFVALEPDSRYISETRTIERFCSTSRTVYRLYNNRYAENDSNHRYVTDLALYQSLQAQGWKGEGPQLCVLH
jgi:Repeat of unknown function (DUF5648)